MKNDLIIFVKEPVPGSVKTRLSPPLTLHEACCLYQAFVEELLMGLPKMNNVNLNIFYQGSIHSIQKWLPQGKYSFIEQVMGDLGQKMEDAFSWSFARGMNQCIILGSDSPTIPASFIDEAYQILDSKDMVIGPSWDGGFYLLGAKRQLPKKLFLDMTWSTDQTFREFFERIKRAELSLGLLKPWYDVDTYQDLSFLKSHLEVMQYTNGRSYSKIMNVLTCQGERNHHAS